MVPRYLHKKIASNVIVMKWEAKFNFNFFVADRVNVKHLLVSLRVSISPAPNRILKQLLDEVFVISRIIKVEVGVISRSRRLRLITLTETLIILGITKTESNICFITHSTTKK